MIAVHPQFIKDSSGKNSFVILSSHEFETILENLEELDDIQLYDDAKKNDSGDRILFSEYLKTRKQKNG